METKRKILRNSRVLIKTNSLVFNLIFYIIAIH